MQRQLNWRTRLRLAALPTLLAAVAIVSVISSAYCRAGTTRSQANLLGSEPFSASAWQEAAPGTAGSYRIRCAKTVEQLFSIGTPKARVEELLGRPDYEWADGSSMLAAIGRATPEQPRLELTMYKLGTLGAAKDPDLLYSIYFQFDRDDRLVATFIALTR